MVNNDNVGEEIENSDKELMVAAEHDFRRCTRPPKDHFKKILEAAYPHHSYPVKHKLMDCTMMKRFMSSVGTPQAAMSWQETQEAGARCSWRWKSQPSLANYDPELRTLCGQLGLGPLLMATRTQTIAGQAKYCLHSTQSPVMLENNNDKPNEAGMKSTTS
jgi:hypothetical protein